MSTKSLLIALGILVVLVGVLIFQSDEPKDSLSDEETAAFAAFKKTPFEEVDRLVVAKGDATAEVVRHGTGADKEWILESSWGYPADSEKLDRLFEELEKIDEGEKRGTSAASHSNFEVGEKKGTRLELYADNSKVATVTLGKRAQTRTLDSYSYVRFGDDELVYEVDGEARSYVGGSGEELDKDYLLHKKLFELPAESQVFEAQLIRPDHNVILERRFVEKPKEKTGEDGGEETASADGDDAEPETEKVEEFHVASGSESFVADEKKYEVRSFLNNRTSISVKAAADPQKELSEYGLDRPQLKVVLKYRPEEEPEAEPKQTTVLFGNAIKDEETAEDKGYYVMLGGDVEPRRIYTIEKWTFNSWDKDLEDFKPKPPEPEEDDGDAAGEANSAAGDSGDPAGEIPTAPEFALDTPDETPDATPKAAKKVAASHILIQYKGASRADESITRTKEEAKKEAERILALVKKSDADFAALAKEHSDGPSGPKGGDLGEFEAWQMAKPFSEAAFQLEVGEISGVVETDFGFHIIQRTK